jgi:N utilization substance protein A
VGSCVGLRGIRIQNIVNELHGEKIDVVEWDPDPTIFIAHALSPSQVLRVDVEPATLSAIAVVPDRQLSLAIGKEGQNARLAAKLTGWRVDIKSDAEAVEPAPAPAPAPVLEAVEAVAAVAEIPAEPAPDGEQAAEGPAPVPEVVEVAAELAEVAAEQIVTEPEPTEAEPEVKVPVEAELAEALFEQEQAHQEPEPVAVAAQSLSELPDEVWTVRRPPVSVEPGQIRFAEDIEELRPDGPGRRRGGRRRRSYRPRRR